jgi:hypothetical protein
MADVLLSLGVEKDQVRNWALRQANRHRLIDLIRVARGISEPPSQKDADPLSRAETSPPPVEESRPREEDDTPES